MRGNLEAFVDLSLCFLVREDQCSFQEEMERKEFFRDTNAHWQPDLIQSNPVQSHSIRSDPNLP